MKTDKTNTCPVPNGILVVIGGHENKGEALDKNVASSTNSPLEILTTFLKLTEKKDPVIEVITTASSEGEESFQDYEKAFSKLGATSAGHIHHHKRSDVLNSDLEERISKADAVFFSGGDQLKLTSVYGGTNFLYELKKRYIHDKLIIGGTSAGAMAFSTPMIFAGNKEVQQLAGEIKVTTGLEFLKDVCIDTHFVDRSRFVRMAQVIATNPTCIGFGIEEDTALIIRKGTEVEVIGSGVVIVVNGFNITDSNVLQYGQKERIFIRDLNVCLLAKGSHYTIPQNSPPHW